MQIADRIVADPAILGGKPIIAGTRISVEFVLGQIGRGVSVEEFARRYQVPADDVLAAIRFAAATLGRDAYVAAAR